MAPESARDVCFAMLDNRDLLSCVKLSINGSQLWSHADRTVKFGNSAGNGSLSHKTHSHRLPRETEKLKEEGSKKFSSESMENGHLLLNSCASASPPKRPAYFGPTV